MPQIDKDFKGKLYDWTIFPKRSENYVKPAYPLFRGVCPSWDNTARKKNKANILYGSSPREYQNWLYNAVLDTAKHWDESSRLVFINAWNEWAEGAYMEPDAKYGYAYLDATRMALIRAGEFLPGRCTDFGNDVLAIVIHAFYPDILAEIIQRIKAVCGLAFKLYVTSPPEKADQVVNLLQQSGLKFEHLITENRGRDVRPFFKIFKSVWNQRHRILLKLHTKKSRHRKDGNKWRNDLYQKLLNSETVFKALRFFAENNDVGMIGPQNHILPMSSYWGSNEQQILRLATRLGVRRRQVFESRFIGGTMFYARTSMIVPMLGLVEESSFEPEKGQIDGTLAHAFERLFSISAIANGLKIFDTTFTDSEKVQVDDYEYVK